MTDSKRTIMGGQDSELIQRMRAAAAQARAQAEALESAVTALETAGAIVGIGGDGSAILGLARPQHERHPGEADGAIRAALQKIGDRPFGFGELVTTIRGLRPEMQNANPIRGALRRLKEKGEIVIVGGSDRKALYQRARSGARAIPITRPKPHGSNGHSNGVKRRTLPPPSAAKRATR